MGEYYRGYYKRYTEFRLSFIWALNPFRGILGAFLDIYEVYKEPRVNGPY